MPWFLAVLPGLNLHVHHGSCMIQTIIEHEGGSLIVPGSNDAG